MKMLSWHQNQQLQHCPILPQKEAFISAFPLVFLKQCKRHEEGEKEFERGEVISHREMMQMIWNKIDQYTGSLLVRQGRTGSSLPTDLESALYGLKTGAWFTILNNP